MMVRGNIRVRQIGLVAAVLREVNRSVMVKHELYCQMKLVVY